MRKDLAGQRFNRWTVKDSAVYEKNQWKWLCECGCGTVRLVNESNLLSGKSQSCGCLSRDMTKSRRTDLRGKRFGSLRVTEWAGYKYGRVAWKCECDCGKSCVVTGHELTEGKRKSCGCLRTKTGRGMRDLRNQRVGKRLLVCYPTEKRDSRGTVIWYCKCDCGKEKEISESALIHGRYQSCGCLKNEGGQWKIRMDRYRHFYNGTCLEYLRRSKRSDNKSGYAGVFETDRHTYSVTIGFCRKRFYLGTYKDRNEALAVRKKAEREIHQDFAACYAGWLKYCEELGRETDFFFEVESVKGGYRIHKGDMPWMRSSPKGSAPGAVPFPSAADKEEAE